MPPNLRTIRWVQQQAELLKAMEANSKFAGLPRGTARGVVVSVDDPLERGRVKVLFDAMNPRDIPAVEGSGEFSLPREGEPTDISHWIDVSPAFKGRQPQTLVGKRVTISLSNGQYQYAVLQDTIFDPQNLTQESQSQFKVPDNSTMSRLPVYEAGDLPPPCEENHGCIVVEKGGPMGCSWTCVCLIRDGEYIWVRHSDLAHGHAGGNDVTSQVDSLGNRPSPGQMSATYDHVFVTSHKEMKKEGRTGYTTRPAGNPWGESCRWSPAPMSKEKPLAFVEGELFDQNVALSFVRNSGFIDQVEGAFTTTYNPAISAAVESVPGSKFALGAIEKAQKALSAYEKLKKVVADPTSFVVQTAEKTLESYIPTATKYVVSTLTNPAGTIKNLISNLPKLPNPFS